MKLKKYFKNPILSKKQGSPWEDLCVLNPAVVYDDETKEFSMLYRAAGNDKEHIIYLGLAKSKNGLDFERCFDKPVLSPTPMGADAGGVEDPRLFKIADWYYLTYASRPFAPGRYWEPDHVPSQFIDTPKEAPAFLVNNSTVTYLALSRDLINWKKCGRITDSRFDDRDVYYFPEKINGKWVRLSRAMEWCGEGYPNETPAMWISYSNDLMEWSDCELLIKGEEWWENKKIGGSTPPLKTDKGWIALYHGVNKEDGAYRVGALLLDLENPSKIIGRTKDFIMEPETEIETSGYYNGCVFPTGNVIVDGTLYVYYGAADKYVCVATCEVEELLVELTK